MIRWFLLLCFLAGSQFAAADDGIFLELGIHPDRLVRLTSDSTAKMEMDIKGDDKVIEMNRKRGINFPINITNHSKKIFTVNTNKADQEGTIQFSQKLVESSSSSEDKDGKQLGFPDPTQEYVGVELNGMLNPKLGMRLTGLSGKPISADKEQLVKAAYTSLLSTFSSAPIGPLKIGDSYSKQAPFAVPMAGQQAIPLTFDTKFTLKKIEGKKAYFDVAITFTPLNALSGAKIELTSSGSGTMEYNLDTKLQEKLAISFEMDLKAHERNVTMSSKMKSTSTTQQEIVTATAQP